MSTCRAARAERNTRRHRRKSPRARCQTPVVAVGCARAGIGGGRCRGSGRSAERVADSARHDDGEPESHERSGLKVRRTSACPIAVVES